MNFDDENIKKFFYHRFFMPIDIYGNNVCTQILSEIKEKNSNDDFVQINTLNQQIEKFNHFLSEETSTEDNDNNFDRNKKIIQQQELFIDSLHLPSIYKMKLYEDVLTGIDKYIHDNKWFYSVLHKKISHTAYGNDTELNYEAFQAMSHRYGLPEIFKLKLLNKIYDKIKNKQTFSYNDALGNYHKKDIDKDKDKDKKEKEKQENRKKFIATKHLLSSTQLSDDERIILLKRNLGICSKCGFSRRQNFLHKADICKSLKNIYACKRDYIENEYYSEQEKHWNRMAANTLLHIPKHNGINR